MDSFPTRFYQGLIACGNALQSPILLAIRLFWGWSFFRTGLGKLQDICPIIDYFQSLGIPIPTLSAYVCATVECVGGACLLLGIASRLIAIPLIINMTVAYLTAEKEAVRTIFSDPQNFVQRTPFLYLFASLLIFSFGPGRFSIDAWIKKRKDAKSPRVYR